MANAEKTPQQIEFFETRIRPILAGECYECHGAEKQEGGLRLDSRDALLLGGDSGPAIVPGDPTASLLLESLQHPDVESRMPKDRPALPANVITDFNLWIKEGAADPRDAPPAAGDPRDWQTVFRQRSDWWSFTPPIPSIAFSMPNSTNTASPPHQPQTAPPCCGAPISP
jgi:hypothetical protein